MNIISGGVRCCNHHGLADGREIMAKHPQLVVSTSTGRTTVVVQPDDTLNIIDLSLVTDLEYREPADAA